MTPPQNPEIRRHFTGTVRPPSTEPRLPLAPYAQYPPHGPLHIVCEALYKPISGSQNNGEIHATTRNGHSRNPSEKRSRAMVARLAKAATADYYIHSQASFRPPGDYYLSGEEPDGIWWNLSGLFSGEDGGTADGNTLDSADFYKLYNGFHPRTGDKLTRNAGGDARCPAYDLTFNADKTVSALWAIAPPELRGEIERAHNDAVRVALEDTVQKYCSYTRIRDKDGEIKVLPADIMAAMFQHGASRSNDPHLHTHCVILNVARAHHDGKWRALHGNPLFSWPKAAGAAYRAELAWLMRTRLGIAMETHGDDHDLTRIAGVPEDLIAQWSKRDAEINDTAARLGVDLKGNRAIHDAVQRATRIAKQHGIDPETRHRVWRDEATAHFENVETYCEELAGHRFEFTEEHKQEITDKLVALPDDLTEKEAVFKYTHVFEKAFNASAGVVPREGRQAMLNMVLNDHAIVELDRPSTKYDAGELLPHARTYTSAHNLRHEKTIHELAQRLVAAKGFGIPEDVTNDRIEQLQAEGYPTSDEQSAAMRAATEPGRISIIEGAAGSGKTTTLRPIADLYREHGYSVIATAVAWRVTLELGTDLNAPNWCVDKLIASIATGKIRLDPNTVIFVDEAGMLSSIQALKILQIARDNHAKIVFAGDTQQQQPVGAGPGLCLIRDIAGTTRVDTIRRQQPDAEDILVAVHGEDSAAANRRAMEATHEEKQAILDEFKALPDSIKPTIRPWQVIASENFRDGKAAAGIAVYNSRGRFHIERDLDRTLDRLVEDWDRFRTEQPEKTSAVIAYSNVEVRALSFLMRERALAGSDTPRFTVQACRGRSPRAKPEPLEIAVGDVLRAGALNWRHQLFNGTYLTVLELEEREPSKENPDETRLFIRARTDRGRIVEFHHDEIRDYHGKIRLDYGYAMTMTSAQGLTVDRAFVFANQKPSRETIYPAFTRHRERLDIYIDRKPVELDIRQQRDEETAAEPVTDTEVRAYLARNWSRERPKEAARDYMSAEMKARHFGTDPTATATADRSEDAALTPRRIDPQGRTAAQWLAANDSGDGKLGDVAARIRYSEIRVKHGLAAETLGRACNKLTASLQQWDRDRAEKGNAAIAMDPAFKRDLRQSAAILRAMTPFIQDDPLHAQLLREHGGIDVSDLKAFADSHARGVSIRRLSLPERREIDPHYKPAAPPRDHAAELLSAIERSIDGLEAGRGISETRDRSTAQSKSAVDRSSDLQPEIDTAMDIEQDIDWEPNFDIDWEPLDVPGYDTPAPVAPSPELYARGESDSLAETGQAARIGPAIPADRQAAQPERDVSRTQAPEPTLAPAPVAPSPELYARGESGALAETGPAPRIDPAIPADRQAAQPERDVPRTQAPEPMLTPAPVAPSPELYARGESDSLGQTGPAPRMDPAIPADRQAAQAERDVSRTQAPDPTHAPAPAPPTSRSQDVKPSPAMQTPPGPTAAQRVEDFHQRFQHHCEEAAQAGLHVFDIPGWNRLEGELQNLAKRPDLAPDDRHFLSVQIRDIDGERMAREQAEAEFELHVARRRDFENNFGRDMPAEQRREALDRFRQEGLVLADNPAAQPERDVPRTQAPEPMLTPAPVAPSPELYARGRHDLLRAYDPKRYLAETSRDAHGTEHGRQPSEQSSASVQQERYQSFANDLAEHVDRARELQRHPYETPGWPELAERCDRLLKAGFLTPDREAQLSELQDHHRAWQQEKANEIRMPFEDDRGPSRGMGF